MARTSSTAKNQLRWGKVVTPGLILDLANDALEPLQGIISTQCWCTECALVNWPSLQSVPDLFRKTFWAFRSRWSTFWVCMYRTASAICRNHWQHRNNTHTINHVHMVHIYFSIFVQEKNINIGYSLTTNTNLLAQSNVFVLKCTLCFEKIQMDCLESVQFEHNNACLKILMA